jgi:ABC-2 type transport system ATP-binding protein
MEQSIVKTTGISKRYGERYAVENMSMEIQRGQIYGLIGQNGAGKTTFIRLLTGLISPTEGRIELFGESGARLGKARARIGSIVETPSLFPNMTAACNIETQRRLAGLPAGTDTDAMLRLCGISGTGNKKVRDFSLGMRQRLALAISLITGPEFLVLDEPINGLDPKGIVENRKMLKSLSRDKGITILISSHILSELAQLATNYGIIHNGRLIKQLSATELQSECRRYVEILTDDISRAMAITVDRFAVKDYEIIGGGELRVFEQTDKTAEMNKALVQSDVPVRSIRVVGQDLESYFMKVTSKKYSSV